MMHLVQETEYFTKSSLYYEDTYSPQVTGSPGVCVIDQFFINLNFRRCVSVCMLDY